MEPTLPPGTLESKIFDGMTIAKGGDFFCFLGAIHIGMESLIRENAQRFVDSIAALASKEVVFIHDDCSAMIAKVKEYGIEIPFKAVHLIEYLVKYLKGHQKEIAKLNKKIAYQRPCASRYTPEKEPILDELFNLIGVERVDRKYDRTDALCCGGIFTRSMPEKVRWIQKENLEDARSHQAQAIIFLCPLCIMSLGNMCKDYGFSPILITDLCRMAIGEIPLTF